MSGYVLLYAQCRPNHARALAEELRREHPGARVVLVSPSGPPPDAAWADECTAASGLRSRLKDGKAERPAAFALAVSNEPAFLKPLEILRALLLSVRLRPGRRSICLFGWSGRYTLSEKLGDALRTGLGMAFRPFYLAGIRALHLLGEIAFPLMNGKPRRAPYSPGSVRRVLLMSLDLVGDLVWTGPAVRSVKAAYPETRVDLLVAGSNEGLARRLEGVDGVMAYDAPWLRKVHNPAGLPGRRPGAWRNLKTRFRLFLNKYDLVADFRGEARHAVLGYLTGAPYRAGFGRIAAGAVKASDVRFLLTHDFEDAGKGLGGQHTLERNLALMRFLGFGGGDASGWLKADAGDEDKIRRLLSGSGASGGGPLIGIQPGASRAEKRWSADGFAAAARELMERHGARVVVAGSADEAPLGRHVAEKASGAVNLCGRTSLGEFVALVKSCDLFISNDTSAISIASAVKTPVLCLVAVATEVMGPYEVDSAVLQKKPDCYDPVAEHCFCPYGYRCLQEITPAEVVAAASRLLAGV